MPTEEKIETVDQLTELLNGSRSIVLADFAGVDVVSVTELRNQLREAEVGYQVVKNRLAKRAAEAAGIDGFGEFFIGPTAIAYAAEDPVAPAKILQKFIDDGGKLAIKTGYLDGQLMTADQVKALASLPSRDELIGKVLGGIQNPLYGFAGVLNGLLRNLVGVVSAIEEQQRGGGEAEAEEA